MVIVRKCRFLEHDALHRVENMTLSKHADCPYVVFLRRDRAVLLSLKPWMPKNVSGTYVGNCQNLTFQKQANITIVLNQDKNAITGNLFLSGELGGGGALVGQIQGNTISFTTTDPLIGKLFWTGTVSGRNIKGAYHVDTTFLATLITGTEGQQGSWTVTR